MNILRLIEFSESDKVAFIYQDAVRSGYVIRDNGALGDVDIRTSPSHWARVSRSNVRLDTDENRKLLKQQITMSSKKELDWSLAKDTPRAEWSNAGAVNKIYSPAMQLLKRLQKALHEYNGVKRPNLAEVTSYIICEFSFHIKKRCKELEQKVANRKAIVDKKKNK